MLKKIICVMMSALMLCLTSCGFDFLRGKTTEDKDTVPVIEIPALPASVTGYGGKVLIQSVQFSGSYNTTEKSMSGQVEMMIEGSDNGSSSMCLVDFNILDENGVIVDSGNMGSGEMMDIGAHYKGEFYVMSVQPGKKYTLKFIQS